MARAGVYLSNRGGAAGSFRRIGVLADEQADVVTLAVQVDASRTFLWAGLAAPRPDDPGRGCMRWELRGEQDPPEGWVAFNQGWKGGSCRSIAFLGASVLAGSHHQGVVYLDASGGVTAWKAPDVNCGLPRRSEQFLFQSISAIATPPPPRAALVMAGSTPGIFRSTDGGKTYQSLSNRDFIDKVTLPETWLFVSGEHDITVASEDEAS